MAPGFWGKVGGFFKRVGSGIKNVATKVWNGVKNVAGKAANFVGNLVGFGGGGDDAGEDYQQQLAEAQKQQQEYELAQARQAQQQIRQQKIQRINNPDFLPPKQTISQI